MPTAFSGERISAARKLFGLTQGALAQAAGVSQGLISQVEKGTRAVTDELLSAVASALGMPRSFFEIVPEEHTLDSLRFRKNATANKTDTSRAEVLYEEVYRVSEDLINLAGFARAELPYANNPVDQDSICDLAVRTREALRVGLDGPIPHVTRLLERAGVPCAPLQLPGEEYPEAPTAVGHFGMSYRAGPDGLAVIGYFPGSKADRDRFTLAHELGHLVLHTHKHQTNDPEQEANLFAGAFLVPPQRADEIFEPGLTLTDYARLKQTWGVSIQALIMHAHHLGKISETRKRSLFTQLSARGWRKSEPVIMRPEEPRLLWKLLSDRFGAKPYSAAIDELALSAVLLRSLAPEPTTASKPTKKHAQSQSARREFDHGDASVLQLHRKQA